MNAHLLGADVLGYLDIRISASGFFRIFGPYKAILKARMVKLVVDDPLKGADVLGYPDPGYTHPDFSDIWPLHSHFES